MLAQTAQYDGADVSLAVLPAAARRRDLDVSVRLKAVGGRRARGGGLMWRGVSDPTCAMGVRNYYAASSETRSEPSAHCARPTGRP